MVSAASPLAGDDGLGTPFGAPPGRRPGLPPTRRPSPSSAPSPAPADHRKLVPAQASLYQTLSGVAQDLHQISVQPRKVLV